MYVNETVDEDLFCGCCTEIVIDPLECEGCNTLFCKKCVFHRKRYDDHCPINCPSQFNCNYYYPNIIFILEWSLLNPHPKYKKLLNELTFKCDCSCNETYSY